MSQKNVFFLQFIVRNDDSYPFSGQNPGLLWLDIMVDKSLIKLPRIAIICFT